MRLYIPSKEVSLVEKNEEEFKDFISTYFPTHALCVHGIKGKKVGIANNIVKEGLLFVQETNQHGCDGTIEPCGLVMERNCLPKAIDYSFQGNDGKVNVYILLPITPKYGNQQMFTGYPRMNMTGDYPKYQKDFKCIMTEMLDQIGYIPKEFIFGYSAPSSDGTRIYQINKDYIEFLPPKEQSEFYKELFETASLYIIGRDFTEFAANNERLFSQINAKYGNKSNYISNTASEYVHLFVERKVLKKEMN